jgi:hypothetical protein
MNSLRPQQTVIAEWYALVNDAVIQSGYHVDELLKHYLIITLNHYSTDCQLSSVVIAVDFLHSLETFGRLGYLQLRQVGDRCLLLAGLFPEQAQKKHVTDQYYISIGRQAYDVLAHIPIQTTYDAELYHQLSDEFLCLINILQTMRHLHNSIIH